MYCCSENCVKVIILPKLKNNIGALRKLFVQLQSTQIPIGPILNQNVEMCCNVRNTTSDQKLCEQYLLICVEAKKGSHKAGRLLSFMFMDLRIGAKMKASRYTQGEKFPSRVPPSLDTYFSDLVRFYVNVFFPLNQSVDFLKEWLFQIRKMCQYFFGMIIYTYLAWPFTFMV